MEMRDAVILVSQMQGRFYRESPLEFASAEEGLRVLSEELDELSSAVWSGDGDARTKAAVRVAALSMRFLIEVCELPTD